MITNEEKKIYEEVKKAYFMHDFLKRVEEKKEAGSCLESLTVDELKKNKIFHERSFLLIVNISFPIKTLYHMHRSISNICSSFCQKSCASNSSLK